MNNSGEGILKCTNEIYLKIKFTYAMFGAKNTVLRNNYVFNKKTS